MADAELKTRERQASKTAATEPLYDRDFYTWTIEQAAALRAGQLAALDLDNLAEEIEDLGKALFRKLSSSFRVILTHMLKWDHQPERRSRSWAASVEIQRLEIEDLLNDNTSLRRRQVEAIERAYRQATLKAAAEMKRDKSTLPQTCPYSLADVIERPFSWPET